MSETQELKKLVKDLTQASNPEEIVSILNVLKKTVKATEPLLRETKAGLAVGKLRTHAAKDVADLAKEIVKKWKNEVDASKASTHGKSPAGAVKSSTSPRTPTTPTTPLSAHPNGATRSAKTDGVKVDATGDKTRDKCAELIYDALASDSAAPTKQILDRAVAVERGVHQLLGSNSTEYRNKMRSLYLNLKDKANPGLRARVVSGELKAARLGEMTSADMASEERRAADTAIAEKNLFLSLGAGEGEAETSAFTCGRCKQSKTRYRQAQTRSADEPMTTFVTCVNCGHRWKFS